MSNESKVQIVPNKETQLSITPYKTNVGKPESEHFGYVQLETNSIETSGSGWLQQTKRNCLLRAKLSVLEAWMKTQGRVLPGRLQVREYLESQVPANVQNDFFNKKETDYEKKIAQYIKRPNKDGAPLMCNGERILRFTSYDPTGKTEDISVQHDVVSGTTQQKSNAGMTPNIEFEVGEETAL
jgi:hypothetical protein